MKAIHEYTVSPKLPDKLNSLLTLAYNLRWSWDHETIDLFRRLDTDLWEETNHSPIKMLGKIKQPKLLEALNDDGFMAHLERVSQEAERYMNYNTWYVKTYGKQDKAQIAYFSFEFGITESLPIYSGGLGILAGDHLKSASDLGIPLVALGFLYQEGYFQQYLNIDGWQQENYPQNDFFNLPVQPVKNHDHTDRLIKVDYPEGPVYAKIWMAQVGQVALFLLDTNIEENIPANRQITSQLYGGELENRMRQEILLGIGGLRALQAVGIDPVVCHMNEGHSAFMCLERIRNLMEQNDLSFEEAREVAVSGNVFTTHTPVPAGNDVFPVALVEKYFGKFYKQLGISKETLMGLGRINPEDTSEDFCMTVLAIRMASFTNGVSKLHGEVSRKMWENMWPGLPENETPITSLTNGIHPPSWISEDMASLFNRYLGPRWIYDPTNQDIWKRVADIPDTELWRTHERRRERLVAVVRRKLRFHLTKRGSTLTQIRKASEVLNPETLTIGFARRFATYKRSTLIFHNPERLSRILSNPDYPVQIIFAGKAHPRDNEGKKLIRQILHHATTDEFRNRIVFVENYEIDLARYLVQGVDVWLNTPLRPMEASGTSGMKASFNGALNLSIMDGWWAEAYSNETGWAIGGQEEYDDLEYKNEVEANAIYNILENEIIPLFYDRGKDGLPREWIALMKSMMQEICPVFNTNRMVYEYNERFYQPSVKRNKLFTSDNFTIPRSLSAWKKRMDQHWKDIHFNSVETGKGTEQEVGDTFEIKASVSLGKLSPEDVSVEIYNGLLNADGEIISGESIPMTHAGSDGANSHTFSCVVPCSTSGRLGYSLRILPKNQHLNSPLEMCRIKWEE
jgi:starch phosphorylase